MIVGTIVLGVSCLEYDISGYGLPHRVIPEMKLPSVFDLFPRRESQELSRAFTEQGKDHGLQVRRASRRAASSSSSPPRCAKRCTR